MVLGLFFCSGATALVYEVVWSKLLAQMFGSTIYAQTVVLAAFMGGLALGNWLVGRWSDRLAQPVRAYGYLEIAIGLYAFGFLRLDGLADRIFVGLGAHLIERSGWLLLLKGSLSAGLLLGPTLLMGGTLPLLAAWLQKSCADPGRRSARFYSVNSLGAVLGAALAGFWLVQTLGIVNTLRVTALVNVLVGSTAILLSRVVTVPAAPAGPDGPQRIPADLPDAPQGAPGGLRWAGLIVALTGGVSMGLEVLSSRSLALIFGSSLQSFAVVLIAFILGIGLGSAWIASPRRRATASERLVVLLLGGAVVWVVVLVFNIEHWVDVYRLLHTGLARTGVGYVYHELMATAMSAILLGIPAALIGAVLPLMMRAISRSGAPLGAKVGVLLTWNTLGAVAGTLLTGFVLMPQVGLRNAFGALALVLAVAALVVAAQQRWTPGIAGAAAAAALTVSLFFSPAAGWRTVMSSGAYRVWETRFDPRLMTLRKEHVKIVFYEDAPDATVSVEEPDGVLAQPELGLRINGKPDAGTHSDLCNQLLLAHLPLLSKPGAKDVFVLGLGSGMTAGAALAYPIEKLDVAENCEPVIRALKLFAGWDRGLAHDPRTRIWHEDARTVLKLRSQLYDVIITEPSNPWTVGVGSVFSREFYELAAPRLKPGGLVSQWFHIYDMNDDIVRLVMRTFVSVFPFMEIWDTGNGDIVMLGAQQPWPTGPEIFRPGFAIERVRTDFAMLNIPSEEALLARQLASQRTGFAIAGDGPLQRDLRPVLEYAAPRALYLGSGCSLLDRFDERTRQQLLAPRAKRIALESLPLICAQLVFTDYPTVNQELWRALFGVPPGGLVPCALPTPFPSPPPGFDDSLAAEGARAFAAGDLGKAADCASLAVQEKPGDPQAEYLLRVISRARQATRAADLQPAAR
jgi:predicted membrane-bound spermidine synthase